MNPRHTIVWVAALSFLAVATRASAHAFLDRAEPRVGSTVQAPPRAVTLWFTQQPEHAFSTIQVFNAEGKQIDEADTHTDPADSRALVVSVPNMPAGTYKVVWRVLSIDTHRTQGSFSFTVK